MILYTWPKIFENEHITLTQILEMGLKYLHIYKPDYDEEEIENLIKKIPSQYHKNIIIHFHHKIALKYDIGGIHYSKNFSISKDFNHFNWKSISIHNESELESIPENINYVIVSPVYKSISKLNHLKIWDFKKIEYFLKTDIKRKYVALGGITPENYLKTKNMGFYDCAFLGSFWNEFFKYKDLEKMIPFLKLLNNG